MSKAKAALKLLGEGQSSCVYAPPMQCRNQPELNQKHIHDVMKWTQPNEDLTTELEIAQVLLKVDPNQNYFVVLNDMCEVNIPLYEEELLSNENGCDPYKYTSEDTRKQFRGYFMTNAGITMEDVINNPRVAVLTGIYWDWFSKLTLAIQKLHQSGWVHNDIHDRNIAIGGDGSPRLIDFGRARPLKDMSEPDQNEAVITDMVNLLTVFGDSFKKIKRDDDIIYLGMKKLFRDLYKESQSENGIKPTQVLEAIHETNKETISLKSMKLSP